jgi:hypothetical protein
VAPVDRPGGAGYALHAVFQARGGEAPVWSTLVTDRAGKVLLTLVDGAVQRPDVWVLGIEAILAADAAAPRPRAPLVVSIPGGPRTCVAGVLRRCADLSIVFEQRPIAGDRQ